MDVLLADEHPGRGEELGHLLAADGHTVRSVSTADGVFELNRSAPPDVIVLSLGLPDTSVFEAVSELRAAETRGAYTPILLVSPDAPDEQVVERAVMAGADDVVAYPARPVECRARLLAQMRHKRRHDMLPSILDEARQLQREATTDPLTGLLNRKALVRMLDASIAKADPFAVLFVDLDKFKSVNDTYGHGVGDEVLKATAGVLRTGTRHGDCAGRIGGEEFVVLLAGADEAVARAVAERLRGKVEALQFPPEGYPPRVTASLGVSVFDPARPDPTTDAILERADGALYEAKHSGRNRHVLAPPPDVPCRRVEAAPSPEPASPVPATSAVRKGAPAVPSKGSTPPRREDASKGSTAGLDALERILQSKLDGGRAALPQFPRVASEALRIVDDPDGSVPELVALVEKDPPIAVRLVALANSALYTRGAAITDVQRAVGRLGLTNTRDLLLQVAYASMTELPKYKKRVSRGFQRAVLCGVATRTLCRALKESDDYAYVTGLFHDIGEACICKILSSLGGKAPKDGEEVEELVRRHHERAGAELARAWGLPGGIVEAAGTHHGAMESLARPVQIVVVAASIVDEVLATGKAGASPLPLDLPSHVIETVRGSVAEAAAAA